MEKREVPTEPRFHGETSAKSSNSMRKIHGKDTSIEIKFRKALWHEGTEKDTFSNKQSESFFHRKAKFR